MSVPARAVGAARTESRGGFLYGWLLVALFIEYARPDNQLTFLDFPYLYSLVPLSLLVVSMFAQGLRPMREVLEDRMAKWVLILMGLLALSVITAPVAQHALKPFEMVLGFVFLFVLIARIVTTEARIHGVIVTLAAAHLYLLAVNPEVLSDPTQRQYLSGGTFLGDGNDFSLSLCILFPCVVSLAEKARSWLWRLIAWTSAVAMILGIVASQSRGAFLGLLAVLLYLVLRSNRKLVAFAVAGVTIVVVMVYAPPVYFERMSTIFAGQRDGSAQGRIEAWKGAIGMGVKNPLLGIGAGHFGSRWGMNAHSNYMLAFAELGFPGLICVLILIFGNLRENARTRGDILARAGPKPGDATAGKVRLLDMLNAGVVGLAVAGAFLSVTYYPHMYVLTALLIAARRIARSDPVLQPAVRA